jgi:ABC-type multidrug transport system ATPase subunit
MCDRIAIIQEGVIIGRGTIDELREQTAAGDASLEELFLKLTGGEAIQELAKILRD